MKGKNAPANLPGPLTLSERGYGVKWDTRDAGRLLGLRLRQTGRQTTFLPLAAGFHELDALATLQDATLGADAAGTLEAAML